METAEMRFLFVFLFVGFLTACTTFPIEKVMKVHQGMSSQEILDLFGKPKDVSQSVCGANTGHPWTCTTWKYGDYGYGDRASFTFSGEPGAFILNNFEFDRD